MSSFDYIEKNILFEYWTTLLRKDVTNIPNNKFIKKPYLENYIIKLSIIFNDTKLEKKILNLIELNHITNEELFLFINNNIELNETDKKNIELYFFNNEVSESYNKISVNLIIYQIKYFRFYNTIVELLFDCNEEDNELYNFILIFIKNNKNEINKYIKKNIKFNIFYNNIILLFKSFENIIQSLINLNLFSLTDDDILNIFLKNLFTNWYNIYKKDILNNNVNEKIKDYILKKSIISTILCLPNV